MTLSFAKVIGYLKNAEGFSGKPYRCSSGALTIGYGRNLDNKGISDKEASFLLGNDVEETWAELQKVIPWIRKLNTARQDALIELGFNLGISGLMDFKRTLAEIENQRFETAAKYLLESRWAKQVGETRSRRIAEMIRTGEYPLR